MVKKYNKKLKKGYKGNRTVGYRKNAYRPRFISRELQLLNRRPQVLTQKCVHQESFFVRQMYPSGATGEFSLLQCKAAFPGEPIFWGDFNGGAQLFPQTLTKTDTTLFSQMGSMYREAYVVGAKIEAHIKFTGTRPVLNDAVNNPSQQEMLCAIGVVNSGVHVSGYPENDLTANMLPSELAEKQNFRVARVMVGGNSNDSSNLTGATNLRTKDIVLKAYYSPKKTLGIKDVADNKTSRFNISTGSTQVLPPEFENPQFILAIGHNCDNTSPAENIVRGAHNDCYITLKTTYIVKCVEPTSARGSNLIITTSDGVSASTQTIRHDEL